MTTLITEVRNARSLQADNARMEVEINHPQHGWIPYGLDVTDADKTINNVLLLELIAGNFHEYVAPVDKPVVYAPSDLSPRRFKYLLALTGLDDVWDALQAELKDTDRAAYAQVKAHRSASTFSQTKTLDLVAMFKDTATRVAPDADLSDEAIKTAWIVAEEVAL